MSRILKIIPLVFDPRGRCNRKGLLVILLVTLALQGGLFASYLGYGPPVSAPVLTVIKLAFFWIAISATVQRLHDVGHSGWWLAAAFGVLLAWSAIVPVVAFIVFGAEILRPFSPLFFMILGLIYALPLAGAIWLHVAKGEAASNRFGPVPGSSGFSVPACRHGVAEELPGPVPA